MFEDHRWASVRRLHQVAADRRRHTGRYVVGLALFASFAVVGCGGNSSSTAGAGGSATSSNTSPSGSANLAYAQAQVNKYKAVPTFPQLPPVPAKKAAGKKVSLIPFSTAVPFIAQATNSAAAALKQAGVTAQQYPSQGQLSQIQQAFGNAISAKDNAVGLFSVSPGTIGPQLSAAATAGIPAVIGHVTPNGTPLAPHAAAQTTGPFDEAARLMADYVIANSKGHADVLIATSNEQMPAPGMVKAINDELHKYCASGCATTTVNVAIADWAQKLQSQVQSSLIADPKINYILPLFDSGVQFVLPGITAAGATNRVKVATFNGTPFVLDDIAKGNTVIADVGESTRWLGRALADQLFRVVTGTKPLVNEHTPYRVFDKSNVKEAGSPAQLGQGYGSGDISGYNKVWGLG